MPSKTKESYIRLSKTAGVNPTIPLCPYCGEPKNEILLTGYEGEEWAKKHGMSDGQMPMYIQLEGDIKPCDKCKEKGIAFVEVEEASQKFTGNKWLLKEEAIKRFHKAGPKLNKILERRVVLVSEQAAEMLGLHQTI